MADLSVNFIVALPLIWLERKKASDAAMAPKGVSKTCITGIHIAQNKYLHSLMTSSSWGTQHRHQTWLLPATQILPLQANPRYNTLSRLSIELILVFEINPIYFYSWHQLGQSLVLDRLLNQQILVIHWTICHTFLNMPQAQCLLISMLVMGNLLIP